MPGKLFMRIVVFFGKLITIEELKGKHEAEHEMRMLAIGMKKGEVHM